MSKYKSLDQYNIPCEITLTDSFVKQLMRIAEAKPFLDECLGTNLEVKLLRKAEVRAITYSNQIEGNHLQEEQVTAILKGKHIVGASKDIKEVQNYHTALDYVVKLAEDTRKLSVRDFCDIQKLVTAGLLPREHSGQVRKIQVSIVNAATGVKIQECPPPHALGELLDDLWQWVADTEGSNPFARAFAFHFIAVAIHPFVDGNGRTVRLMQHLFLLKDGQEISRFVPSETAIMRERSRYYLVLSQARELRSLNPILEFLAECFATSAAEVIAEGRSLLKSSSSRSLEARHQKIIKFAKGKGLFSMQEILRLLPDVPRRTLERDLNQLTKQKLLKAAGDNKARVYSLKKPTSP